MSSPTSSFTSRIAVCTGSSPCSICPPMEIHILLYFRWRLSRTVSRSTINTSAVKQVFSPVCDISEVPIVDNAVYENDGEDRRGKGDPPLTFLPGSIGRVRPKYLRYKS